MRKYILECTLVLVMTGGSAFSAYEFTRTVEQKAREVVSPKTDTAPQIDGRLDDACWKRAARLDAFYKMGSADPAGQQTICFVTHDEQAVYFGFVCEDPDIKSENRPRDGQVWEDDCVEIFLHPDLDLAREIQFIVNASGSRFDSRVGDKSWNPQPDWQAATRSEDGLWFAEVAVPYQGLTRERFHWGRRGSRWLFRVARENYGKPADTGPGPKPELSSWTRTGRTFHNVLANATLYFESKNLLANGNCETDANGDGAPDGWRLDGQGRTVVRLALDTDNRIEGQYGARFEVTYEKGRGVAQMTVSNVRPGQTYRVTVPTRFIPAEGSAARCYVMTNGDNMTRVPANQDRFFRNELTVALRDDAFAIGLWFDGSCTLYVDDIRVEEMGDNFEPGTVCLTANARGRLADRNKDVGARYTYTEFATDSAQFPFGPMGKLLEGGRAGGWVPVSKGILTDGVSSTVAAWTSYWSTNEGVDIVFDLGAEYLVQKVTVAAAGSMLYRARLDLKAEGSTRFLPIASSNTGAAVGFAGFTGLRARARFVRLNCAVGESHAPGIAEVQIWGRPVREGDPLPSVMADAVPAGRERPETVAPLPELPVGPWVFPEPQEIRLRGDPFAITEQTKIVIGDLEDPAARTVAEDLRKQIVGTTGRSLAITSRDRVDLDAQGLILLGRVGADPWIEALAAKEGMLVSAEEPGTDGYVLKTTPRRALLVGCDDRGLFYAAQSLAQLTTMNAAGTNVPGVTIRDWPDKPVRAAGAFFFENPTKARWIQAMARYRLNQIWGGRKRVVNTPVAERFFMEILPGVGVKGAYWMSRYPELIERGPDENLKEMGRGRRVVCPSNPKTYEVYAGFFNHRAAKFPKSRRMFLNFDEFAQKGNGGRWNVCDLCRARNLSDTELLVDFIDKLNALLQRQGGWRMAIVPDEILARWPEAIRAFPKDTLCLVWHDPMIREMAAKGYPVVNFINITRGTLEWPYKDPKLFAGAFLDTDQAFDTRFLLWWIQELWSTGKPAPGSTEFEAKLEAAMKNFHASCTGIVPPSLRSGEKAFFAVDLRGVANLSFKDDVPGDGRGWLDLGPAHDLRALPVGKRRLRGVPFQIIDPSDNHDRACVMVENRGIIDRTMPIEVEISVGKKAASLFFLHTSDRPREQDYQKRTELVGYYVITYEDGTFVELPLKWGINLVEWDAEARPTRATMAWRGQDLAGETIRIYWVEWVNPTPELAIAKVLFRSAWLKGGSDPILIALSGLAPTRADLAFWKTRGEDRRPTERLGRVSPTGKRLDLAGGTLDGKRYVAPGGITFEVDSFIRSGKRTVGTDSPPSSVSNLIYDNNWCWRTTDKSELTIRLPEPKQLSGVSVTGVYRIEQRAKDFDPVPVDYEVEASPDGRTWQQVGARSGHVAELEGEQFHPLGLPETKEIRIRVRRPEGSQTRTTGLAHVALYEHDDDQ